MASVQPSKGRTEGSHLLGDPQRPASAADQTDEVNQLSAANQTDEVNQFDYQDSLQALKQTFFFQ